MYKVKYLSHKEFDKDSIKGDMKKGYALLNGYAVINCDTQKTLYIDYDKKQANITCEQLNSMRGKRYSLESNFQENIKPYDLHWTIIDSYAAQKRESLRTSSIAEAINKIVELNSCHN